jgi:hypothetical protein
MEHLLCVATPWLLEKKKKKKKDKCIISPYGWPKLQNVPCGIKMNSEVLGVRQKNDLVPVVKFH